MGIFEGCGTSSFDEDEDKKKVKRKSKSGLSDRVSGGRAGLMDDIFSEDFSEPVTAPARRKRK